MQQGGAVMDAIPAPATSESRAADPIVRITGVVKRFGPMVAVDDVSLDVERGEFLALLGPSGCGKTTLLRLLAGFEQADAGEIAIDGARMTGVPPYARPVNMMFQSYALFPHMSVVANVAFGLKQIGMRRAAIAARVEEMLSLVEMRDFAARRPHQLSGGQRQRVALARALARQPKLLLLDEPLAALDRKLRERTQLELVYIQRRLGITFVVVTHDQEEALSMASRIAVMNGGRICQIGTPADVYENPRSRFVADFLGQVNLFEGRVRSVAHGLAAIDAAEAGGELLASVPPDLRAGDAVALALRPEKLVLGPGEALRNRLAGRVIDILYVGNVSTLHVELPSGKRVRVAVTNARRGEAGLPERGDEVRLGFAPEAAVVLTE